MQIFEASQIYNPATLRSNVNFDATALFSVKPKCNKFVVFPKRSEVAPKYICI